MSAAAAVDAAEVVPKKGKKKLIILIAAVVVLLLVAGGGAAFYLKHKAAAEAAAAEAEDEDGDVADTGRKHAAKAGHKKDEKRVPPVFVPLDPFVVNLADREADRFAQVGITLEVADAHVGDEIKAYMPAIRNNILLLLAHKTSAELMDHEGKEQLAREVRREALRPMGFDLPDEDADTGTKKKKKKAKAEEAEELPIKSVQFSSFIIQ
ncbi:flagellar basal body-associated FliL family protein [Ideonella sp. YS5]|uniref:flagellar basal body-associated FliL family protein n=1 Tax=Ideonella sp. YS5 TaxID=3453714 RepID=UPI003EEC680A